MIVDFHGSNPPASKHLGTSVTIRAHPWSCLAIPNLAYPRMVIKGQINNVSF